MHILAPNAAIEKYPYSIGDLRKDNPNTSFPKNPSEQLLASYGVYPVTRTDRPEYDSIAQNLTEGTPERIEGVWTQVWIVTPASPEEVEQRTADRAASVRSERDRKLQETDWRVFKAYERNENIPAELAVYRQALRDITAQEGFPRNVTWPAKP